MNRQAHLLESLYRQYAVGLTGNIACGKSAVAKIISDAGYFLIDADHLAREVSQKNGRAYAAIVKEFGDEILEKNGEINRKVLGKIVFSSPAKRKKLEAIVHPAILKELDARLIARFAASEPAPWFYDAALLFEAGRNKDFAKIWVVSCDPQIQLKRLMKRDGLDATAAQQRIDAQMDIKIKEAQADVVIYNNGNLESLRKDVLHQLHLLKDTFT